MEMLIIFGYIAVVIAVYFGIAFTRLGDRREFRGLEMVILASALWPLIFFAVAGMIVAAALEKVRSAFRSIFV